MDPSEADPTRAIHGRGSSNKRKRNGSSNALPLQGAAAPDTKRPAEVPPYGPAQAEFVKATRRAIDAGELSITGTRWLCIRPPCPTPKRPTSYYYLKPLTVWVPHLIIPGHVPHCPNCASPEGVDLTKGRWVKYPKCLLGTRTHRYLDTKLYFCGTCNRQFNGTHPVSLTLGNARLLGHFSFYVPRSHSIGVDEELYRFIQAHTRLPVEHIVDKLQQMVLRTYNQDLTRYLMDARDGRVLSEQEMSDPRLQKIKKRKTYEDHADFPKLEQLRADLAKAQERANDDIDFQTLLVQKNSRNKVLLDLPCLGRAKLLKIMEQGMLNARQFLASADASVGTAQHDQFLALKTKAKKPSTVDSWVIRVREDFAKRRDDYTTLQAQVQQLEQALGIPEETEEEEEPPNNNNHKEPPKYTHFSKPDDRSGYNARFVVKNTVKDVVAEDFHRQRFVYRRHMLQLGGEWLRLYFLPEMGKKIIAHELANNQGGYYYPYKCLAVVLNEKGLVVWWAMIPNNHSGGNNNRCWEEAIFAPLQQLKARLDRLGHTVESIFCPDVQICSKLHQIFGVVVLDVLDWIDRWNTILVKPTSDKAETFRALLCKAVLGIPLEEFQRGKRQAKSALGREPTVKEVLRECHTAAPSPEQQEQDVMNVVYYFYQMDIQLEAQVSIRGPRGPARLFQPYDLVAKTVEEQLECIQKSSLSDQESTQAKGEITQLVEQLNKQVFFNNRGCGVRRAERGIWSVIDEMNQKAMEDLALPRLAESPPEMVTQAMAIAQSLGMEEPPFQAVDSISMHPTTQSETENLGFDVVALDGIEDNNGEANEDILDDFEMEDIDDGEAAKQMPQVGEVFAVDNNPPPYYAAATTREQDLLVNEGRSKAISRHTRELENFMAFRELHNDESTLKAFRNLADSEQWAQFLETKPFGDRDDGPIEAEELLVFEQMEPLFDENCTKSYTQFEKAWNFEAGRRLKSRCNGGSDILLSCKNAQLLFDRHDLKFAKLQHISQGLDRRTLGKYCITCAHMKREHAQFESFGKSCTKGYCARCGALEKWHDEYGSKMGFFCKLTPVQTGMGADKIERFDREWRKDTGDATGDATSQEGFRRYIPKHTRLMRKPPPDNLTLPLLEDMPEKLMCFKIRGEPFSRAVVRSVEDRFIIEGAEKVYSPLKLWVKAEREKEEHKLSSYNMGRLNEFCKVYYAIKVLKVLERGVIDQQSMMSAEVKARPPERESATWLDIVIEIANAPDLDLKILELGVTEQNDPREAQQNGERVDMDVDPNNGDTTEEAHGTDTDDDAEDAAAGQETAPADDSADAAQATDTAADNTAAWKQYHEAMMAHYAAYAGYYASNAAPPAATAPAAAAPKQPDPLKGFDRRRYCSTCGFKHKEHAPNEKVNRVCKRGWCNRCGEREEFHEDCPMGPLCTKGKNGRTDPSDWFREPK